MSADATAFSITAKGPNQELVTIRGNSWEELNNNAYDAGIRVADLYRSAFPPELAGERDDPFESAQVNVVRAFPQATPVAQPVPQPQPVAAAPVQAGPSCQHGPRVFKSSQTTRGQWDRWECAVPWRRGNDASNNSRCKAINQ